MRYRFGSFEVDEDRYALTRDGEHVEIRPKPLDLLLYLLRHRDRALSKQELLDALWPGVAVAEASLTTAVRSVRRALGEEAGIAGVLQTVRGRGYKISVPVEEVAGSLASDEARPEPMLPGFVGRKPELAELESRLAEAVAGRGQLILLSGEPGIGKTRTAREFAARAARSGARVLWGRSYESPGAPAYWPWVQIIRAYADSSEPKVLASQLAAGASVIAEIVPELREKLTGLDVPLPIHEPDRARFRLFDSVTRFLRAAAQEETLVLVLDDLHGADKGSLLLLEFLAHELADSRILVLGAFRETELTTEHPLQPTLAELLRVGVLQRLPLRGLSREDLVDLFDGESEAPTSLVDAIHERTDGNPLFAQEIVHLLQHDTDLMRAAGRAGSLRELPIPDGVREAVGQRLARLSPRCREVLTLASVLGREFRLEELQGLVGAGLLDALDEAMRVHLVGSVPQSAGRYQFSHGLVADALYAELTPARRVDLHGRVGAIVERLHAQYLEPCLPELAHHFFEAAPGGQVERAVATCTHAGDRSSALLAYEDSVRFYQMALQALELAPDEPRRCTLLRSLADSQYASGELSEALQTLEQAAQLARALGNAEDFAQIALVTAQIRQHAWLSPSAELVQEALRGLEVTETALRARLLGQLSIELLHTGLREGAETVGRQALAMAQRIGDPGVLAFVQHRILDLQWGPESAERSVQVTTEILELLERVDEPASRRHNALFWRAQAALELGDFASLDADMRAMARVTRETGEFFYNQPDLGLRTMRALYEGRFEQAETLAAETLALGQRMKAQNAEGTFGVQMFTLRREQGRLKELEPAVRLFAGQGSAAWRPGLTLVYSELGLRDEARAEFEQLSTDGFGGLEHDALWTGSMAYLAEVCGFLCDAERAEILYALLAPWDGKLVVVGGGTVCLGAVARYLGLLAATQGDFARAQQHYEAALSLNEQSGGLPWCAHTEYDYARLLLQQGGSKARRRAADLLTSARETAEQLGMARLLEQAGAELTELGTRRRRS